jgi:hypothetical protein
MESYLGNRSLFLDGSNPQGEFFKLCRGCFTRGLRKRAGRPLGLWKGDDIPDGGLSGHEHNKPVKSKGNTAMGWGAEIKGLSMPGIPFPG